MIVGAKKGYNCNSWGFTLRQHFEYINDKNYHLLCNIFSPSGKVASSQKTSLAFWGNNFLIKQITIYIKMSGCKFRGHTK